MARSDLVVEHAVFAFLFTDAYAPDTRRAAIQARYRRMVYVAHDLGKRVQKLEAGLNQVQRDMSDRGRGRYHAAWDAAGVPDYRAERGPASPDEIPEEDEPAPRAPWWRRLFNRKPAGGSDG